jgi:hypothetical protein
VTRRGSLVYYLSAWICGGTFASVALWIVNSDVGSPIFVPGRWGARLFSFCFAGLILALLPALLAAFLLRILARAARLRKSWQWALGGGLVTLATTAVLCRLDANPSTSGGIARARELFTYGPALMMAAGWWTPIVPGALTGTALSRIEAAFGAEPRGDGNPPLDGNRHEDSGDTVRRGAGSA